jgi:hypothetical protein
MAKHETSFFIGRGVCYEFLEQIIHWLMRMLRISRANDSLSDLNVIFVL